MGPADLCRDPPTANIEESEGAAEREAKVSRVEVRGHNEPRVVPSRGSSRVPNTNLPRFEGAKRRFRRQSYDGSLLGCRSSNRGGKHGK